MKHLHRVCPIRAAALAAALVMCLSACAVFPTFAKEETYADTPYVFDFSSVDAVDACAGLYNVSTVPEDGAMTVRFHDTDKGKCFDPYFNLPLPKDADVETYHWFAMLVKTDKHDLRGELRFLTTSTGTYNGGDYPCVFFNYQNTDDWQLIVFDLTDRKSLNYIKAATKLSGSLINLRLDPFNNDCSATTAYQIKAYALFKTREDAETFVNFKSAAQKEQEKIDSVDYDSFWRGPAFKSPALPSRLRWVSYGFADTSPVDKFLRQGYGGIVSNVNFNQNYLKDDKEFERLAEVYDYAVSKGMTTWIYDEYQWPSGKAYGQVLDGHDEYEATGIEHHRLTGNGGSAVYRQGARDLRILRADLTDDNGTQTLTDCRFDLELNTSGKWTLDVYVLRKTYDGVENRNDFSTLRDVDLLNKGAAERFIELTHQRYKDKMGGAFDHVEAFFTDEPQLGNRAMVGYAVWTEGLDDIFKQTYGYELNIPSIFFGDTDLDRATRMNYYQLVASLFKTSYFETISAWCEANGTASSGHLLFEENMNDQIETYGGDFMQVVGAMDIPGVDLLWVDPAHLLSTNYVGSYMGIRYVASAAKNAGKTNVMVEFNPDAMSTLSKTDPLGECIAGLSLSRLLGTTTYNIINPQLNLNNEQVNRMNVYLGRLNTLLDGAVECGQVAIFYPIATVQAYHDADSGHGSETNPSGRGVSALIDSRYQSLCKTLLTQQILYTVLDDETLRTASVASDGCLCAGLGAYKVLIVPYAQYMSVDALKTLVTFKEAGGTVLFFSDTPAHGLAPDQEDEVAALMEKLSDCPVCTNAKSMVTAVKEASATGLCAAGGTKQLQSLLMGDFETSDKDIYYLTNTAAAASTFTVTCTDGYAGEVTIYRPLDGFIETVTIGSGIELSFAPGEAVIVVRDAVNDHREKHESYVPETEVATDPVITEPADTSVVTAPVTTAETDADTQKNGSGCRSAVGPGALTVLFLALSAAFRKKRTD